MDAEAAAAAVGRSMYTKDQQELGTIRAVYTSTGADVMAAVSRGYLTGDPYLVPLRRAQPVSGGLMIPYSRDQVADGPDVEIGAEFPPELWGRVLSHYETSAGPEHDPAASGRPQDTSAGHVDGPSQRLDAGTDRVSGAPSANDEVSIVRSEERLQVSVESRPYARARVRRYVTTETQTVSVTVRREYAVLEVTTFEDAAFEEPLEREVIVGDNAILLSEEVPEVVTRVRPVARAALHVITRTEDQTFTATVQHENVRVSTTQAAHVEAHGSTR